MVAVDSQATIRVRMYGQEDVEYAVGVEPVTVGRDESCDLVLPNELKTISRMHAQFTFDGHALTVRDLDSQNGVFVNQKRVSDQVRLRGDEEICLGLMDGFSEARISVELPAGLAVDRADQTLLSTGGWKALEATAVIQRQKDFTIGRAADNDLQLISLIISRHHARISVLDGEYRIQDLDSQNGTIVNGSRVRAAQLFDGDLIEIGDHLLQFQGGAITPYTSHGFRLDVIDLSKSFSDRRGSREIIKGIDLTVLPREFVAVVGASGAGKTTFLRALNGTSPGGGQVLINGHDFYKEYDLFRHQLGYVPQFEILHTSLTVDQALGYAARLRLPADISPAQREARIKQALETVAMDRPETRNNRIANLSGGQRKRVSIAVELLADPRLIFLDEATSGLDPGLEKKMMYTLRQMADEGRTVILITHATANIVQADHVLFLSEGRMVYFGSPGEALPFFEVDEFADIYDRIERKGADWEQIFRTEKPDAYQKNVVERQQSQRSLPVQEIKRQKPNLVDFFRQLGVLTERAFKVISSDRVTLLLLMLLFPLTATLQLLIATPHVITGDPLFLADPIAAAQTAVEAYVPFPNMNTFVFVMGLEAVLVGLFVPSTELLKERTIYRRERMINLGIFPYLLSKVIVFTSFSFIQVLMYLLVLSTGVDFPANGVYFPGSVEIFVTLFLTMLAGNGLGLLISALSKNNEIAIYLLTLMLFFQFFFAGTVFDLRGKAAEPLSYMTTTRWSLTALGTTIGMEQITESTVLCSTLDNPLTPGSEKVTRCFSYPEAADDLMLAYGDQELMLSWGVLILTMLVGLGLTGLLVKRLDTL